MTDRLTYPAILNAYYALNMPNDLGIAAHSMFLALVHKANTFRFQRPELIIPNSEMSLLSVLDERAIYKAREKLVGYQLGSNRVVEYKQGRRGQAGVYTTHFALLVTTPCTNSVAIGESNGSSSGGIPENTSPTPPQLLPKMQVSNNKGIKKERKNNLDIVPYSDRDKISGYLELSKADTERLDQFGLGSIRDISDNYYRMYSEDTVRLFNLLRVKTPNEVLALIQKAKEAGVSEDALGWVESEAVNE
jgi:hypothetical protein